jgi:hypothetical protein
MQPASAGAVISLLISGEFHPQAQVLAVQIIGAALWFLHRHAVIEMGRTSRNRCMAP